MIDNKDQMLLIKKNNSYRLPRANNPKNGSDGLISYLREMGIECAIESLYSVYYDEVHEQYAIFYRGVGNLLSEKSREDTFSFFPQLKFNDATSSIKKNILFIMINGSFNTDQIVLRLKSTNSSVERIQNQGDKFCSRSQLLVQIRFPHQCESPVRFIDGG